MNILQWMNTPEDIIQGAYDYIFVIFLGIPVTYLYNMLAGIIRSLGDSKTPVYFLLLSSLMNIGLDFFTILGLGMGVGGPALATVISQGISAVLCLIYMIKHYPILHMKNGEWKPDGRMLGVLCGMGIPMGLQYSITDRKRGPSDSGEFAGVHGGCGCLHGKQGQHVFLLSV